jgi:hypothetical protein
VIGSPQAPRNWDQGAIIAAIDKRSDWSFEKKEGVKAYARQHMAQDEAALNDQYEDAADNLHTWIGNYQASHNGDDPPASALPSSLTSRVKPSMLADLRGNLAKAERAKYDKAVQQEREDKATFLELQAIEQPDAFIRQDLRQFAGAVPSSSLSALAKKKAELQKSVGGFSPDTAASAALADFERGNPGILPRNPGPKDATAFAEYNRQRLTMLKTISAQFQKLAGSGQIPNDKQRYEAARVAAQEVRFKSGSVARAYVRTPGIKGATDRPVAPD